MNVHISNGRLIDPQNGIDARRDVYITDGRIAAIGTAPADFAATHTIDATGCIVCPGLVDLAARLREPGYEYKATLESEMTAAVAGGITALACPPDTDPPLDEPGLVEMLKHRAKQLDLAHLYPLGALTRQLKGEQLTEMCELTEAGCVGFFQADAPIIDTLVLRRTMQYAVTFGFTVWLRPEDYHLAKHGVAHDGEVAARLGLRGISSTAETIALDTIIRLARETGVRLHVCRLSCAESVDMIRAAKAERLPISCDVAVHHLHLTEHDIGYFDSNCHLRPPLRTQRDRDALSQGVADGTIDAVCSDHTPIDEDAKLLPFAEADVGATGLELLLPLTLKWAATQRQPVGTALAALTSRPAAILGVSGGHLGVGSAADICIFDPDAYWKVDATTLKSQGKNTPFYGLELPGKVRHTLVAGRPVYVAD